MRSTASSGVMRPPLSWSSRWLRRGGGRSGNGRRVLSFLGVEPFCILLREQNQPGPGPGRHNSNKERGVDRFGGCFKHPSAFFRMPEQAENCVDNRGESEDQRGHEDFRTLELERRENDTQGAK